MTPPPGKAKVITRHQIRQALKAWPNSAELGELPLAGVQSVAAQRVQLGHADSTAGRGIALRHLLREAIARLKPAGEESPRFEQPQWRIYHIMHEQFLQNRRAQDIRDEMGVSESGYFNDQRKALEALEAIFKEWELLATSAAEVADSTAAPSISSEPQTAVSNLPHPATPFIGREAERERIAALLAQDDCRLISIIGPGGMGKTRLAIQAAADHEPSRTAYFIQLDAIETADLLVPTIAQTVHFAIDSQEDALQQLLGFLRAKHWLLVLDNFEHLTQHGTALIPTLLDRAPQLKLIVTSRERLNLRGEWVIDLQGLDVPEKETAAPEGYSAVRLFLDALERVRAGQTAAPEEIPAVVHICQLVQGMPLGLELAASWGAMLSCADIAAEIQNSLDFLKAAYRDLPARHQSLRAVFNHSWSLLSAPEQAAFRKLAVFRGGFDRAAAKEIAEAHLPLLHALSSKSLLRSSTYGRYTVHPLLRQFAREALRQQAAEWDETHNRHGRYYAAFMHRHVTLLKQGGQQREALEQAERELENIRLAWRWALTEGENQMLLEAAEAIYHFFVMTNRVREGHATVGLIVEHLQAQPLETLSQVQQRLLGFAEGIQARFAHIMGQKRTARAGFARALSLLEKVGQAAEVALIRLLAISAKLETDGHRPDDLYHACLVYFESVDDQWGIAATHVRYVDYLRTSGTGDEPTQRHLMEVSLRLRQQIGDQRGVANCLNYLCDLAYARGDYAEAQKRASQSLLIHQTLGNDIGRAHSLNHLGQVAASLGVYTEARHNYQESLALLRLYGNAHDIATALDCVGYITYLMGEYESAEQYYQESLQISREIEDVNGEAWSLHNLGDIARARGQYERAKQLYTESRDLHQVRDPLGWGSVVALDKLGRITLLLGEIDEAEQHFLEALRIATVTKRNREALDALYNLSNLLAQQGQKAQAAALLTVVINHPATAKETRDAAHTQAEASAIRPPKNGLTLAEISVQLLKRVENGG